jgi:hypothetical protein
MPPGSAPRGTGVVVLAAVLSGALTGGAGILTVGP